MYASQMPKWHNLIQSEVARSLLLAGMPPALPALMPTAPSTAPHPQSASAYQGSEPMGTEGSTVQPEGSSSSRPILLLDGPVNCAAAEAASAQLHPVLLHQAMVLTITAELGPADIGACEPDSSGSDASESESTGPESAADEGFVAAGFEKMLVIAVIAAFKTLDQPAIVTDSACMSDQGSDASHTAFATALEVRIFILSTCICQPLHAIKLCLTTHCAVLRQLS